jgi:hypothetical protein
VREDATEDTEISEKKIEIEKCGVGNFQSGVFLCVLCG